MMIQRKIPQFTARNLLLIVTCIGLLAGCGSTDNSSVIQYDETGRQIKEVSTKAPSYASGTIPKYRTIDNSSIVEGNGRRFVDDEIDVRPKDNVTDEKIIDFVEKNKWSVYADYGVYVIVIDKPGIVNLKSAISRIEESGLFNRAQLNWVMSPN